MTVIADKASELLSPPLFHAITQWKSCQIKIPCLTPKAFQERGTGKEATMTIATAGELVPVHKWSFC
ncbi:MAG: hypothetical protein ABR605_04045, partial [Desulfurivibrionaceae bacterium]